MDQLLAAYSYFCIPRDPNTHKPLFTKVDVQMVKPSEENHVKAPISNEESSLHPAALVDVDCKAADVISSPIVLSIVILHQIFDCFLVFCVLGFVAPA